MIQNKDRKTTIKIEGYRLNDSLQLTLNWDADINDWVNAFRTILIHQTFPEDTVKELFEEKDLYYTRDSGDSIFETSKFECSDKF
jgi:hypothetical protein